jgi:hypothetical protein
MTIRKFFAVVVVGGGDESLLLITDFMEANMKFPDNMLKNDGEILKQKVT